MSLQCCTTTGLKRDARIFSLLKNTIKGRKIRGGGTGAEAAAVAICFIIFLICLLYQESLFLF